MYTAGTTACCAMFVHPGSSGRKGAVNEGGKGNKFFHLMCHYIADSKFYVNLLTDVTSPTQHNSPFEIFSKCDQEKKTKVSC